MEMIIVAIIKSILELFFFVFFCFFLVNYEDIPILLQDDPLFYIYRDCTWT
jgi:hypothetical protein